RVAGRKMTPVWDPAATQFNSGWLSAASQAWSIIPFRYISNRCMRCSVVSQAISESANAPLARCFRFHFTLNSHARRSSTSPNRSGPRFGISAEIRLHIVPGSLSQCQKYEQENPKPIHEMPVNRSQLGSHRLRDARALPLPELDVKQRQDSAGKMRAMRRSQEIEEAAARICRQ